MIQFKYFRKLHPRAKGVWKLHAYDRTLTAVGGVVSFEKEPPPRIVRYLKIEGFDRVTTPIEVSQRNEKTPDKPSQQEGDDKAQRSQKRKSKSPK